MSLPSFEAVMKPGYETLENTEVEDVPASDGTNISPPPYVQPALPVYSVQSSPPPYNFVSTTQLQQIVTVSAVIQPQNPMKYYETFLKGSPKRIGILIITTAIGQIALGIAHAFIIPQYLSYISGIMFWGPVFYIIAGSLSIAAQSKPNTCLIRGSLSMNIVTSIFSAIGVILSGIDIALLSDSRCYGAGSNYAHHCYPFSRPLAVVSVLLVTNLLLLCASISTSVFGCRSLKHVPGVQQVLVIQNGMVLSHLSPTQPGAFLQPQAYPSGDILPGEPNK